MTSPARLGPDIRLDFPEAQVRVEAQFQSGKVASYTHSVEKQAAARKVRPSRSQCSARTRSAPQGPVVAANPTKAWPAPTVSGAMITDATATINSVLMTDIIACVPLALVFSFGRVGRPYTLACTQYMLESNALYIV